MKRIVELVYRVSIVISWFTVLLGGLNLSIKGIEGVIFFIDTPRLFGLLILVYVVCSTYSMLKSNKI